MRSLFVTTGIIGLLLIACFTSACVSPFGQETPPAAPNATPSVNVGVVPVEMTPEPRLVSYSDAKARFKDSNLQSLNPFTNMSRIMFVRGGNVDGAGNAEYWIFAVSKGDTSELRIFSNSGWSVSPWNKPLNTQEIDLNKVVSPVQILKNL
ncbi:MAG: hypothetical protein GYA23_13820, partial [Methanomicrobiales archaeon]|nr:hypothetical protein [Methanomicrobiales archaeon]